MPYERYFGASTPGRGEFIRLALRRAIDLALDRATELAYRKTPLPSTLSAADLTGWDEHNRLAKPAVRRSKSRKRKAME